MIGGCEWENVISRFGLGKWFGISVIRLNISLDSVDQFFHTFEDSSTDAPESHDAKPSLNLVHPRRPGWSKMQMESTMSFKPFIHLFVLVRAVVVRDQVQVYLGRSFVIRNRAGTWRASSFRFTW